MKGIMISGGRPTGKLHLGHYMGAFKQLADLQKEYQTYFVIADLHMLTTKSSKEEIASIRENALNMVIDGIGMGVDPNETTFYLQSNIEELPYIFTIIQNLVNTDRVAQTPSLVEMKKHSKMDDMTLGLLAYPVLEAADIFAVGATVAPVGKDNIDHIDITRDIVQKINHKYDADFTVPNYLTTENNYVRGLDGSNKMSKSLDNAIYVRDTDQDIRNKVNKAKWTNDDNNVVIEYLRIFGKEYEKAQQIVVDYVNGVEVEKAAREELIRVLIDWLEPMRKRMQPYLENKQLAEELLRSGTIEVCQIVKERCQQLKTQMGMFDLQIKDHQKIKKSR